MSNPQRETEECRREVLCYLAERQALAFPVEAVQRKLRIDGSIFALEQVEAALTFLAGYHPAPLVEVKQEQLGSTKYYQATSAGVLFHERNR